MCTVCGCGETGELAGGHHHGADHGGEATIGGMPPVAMDAPRVVTVERDILALNDAFAATNRRRLSALGVLTLNLVSSPGSGKTTLLVRTIEALSGRLPLAVIEGDQQTELDSERIRAAGAPALQITTGNICHLDARMVAHGIERLAPEADSLLFIENVGNLVCPAAFDLGESAKVVILSTTEGDDKPLKYPAMFQAADLMILNKSDLLPYVPFDVERCGDFARRINPAIDIVLLSALNGDGMEAWLDWLEDRRPASRGA